MILGDNGEWSDDTVCWGNVLLKNWAEKAWEGMVTGSVTAGVSCAVIGPHSAIGCGLVGAGAGFIGGSVWGIGETVYSYAQGQGDTASALFGI